MSAFTRIGPGGLLLATALLVSLVAVSLGFFVQRPTSSTREWRRSCWISPCLASRARKFLWERHYLNRLSFPEAVAVGANDTIAVIDRAGIIYALSPPYSAPLTVVPLSVSEPPELVDVGADGTISVVSGSGIVYVLPPPYSDPRTVSMTPLYDSPDAVSVGADGTIAVVSPEGFVYVLSPPYSDFITVEVLPFIGPFSSVAVGPRGTVVVVTFEGTVYILSPPYSDYYTIELAPSEPGNLFGRSDAVAIGPEGTIAIVAQHDVYVLSVSYSDLRTVEPHVADRVTTEYIAVGGDGTIAVVSPLGTLDMRSPPYNNPLSLGYIPNINRPLRVAVGANGTIAVVSHSGTIDVFPAPYSDVLTVDPDPFFGPPEDVDVGANGTIAVVDNRMRVLVSVPPYSETRVFLGPVRPAHWSWFALGLTSLDVALLIRLFLQSNTTRDDSPSLPSIESDKPISDASEATTDAAALAMRIARFLRHPDASVPLTIALTGKWGSGKSSLMRLVHNELVPKKPISFRYPCIWFNAWHHQNEEYLFASLMESIRHSLLSDLTISGYVSFHLNLLGLRIQRVGSIVFVTTVAAGLIALSWMLYAFIELAKPAETYLLLLIPSTPLTILATTRWNPMKAFRVSPASLIRPSARWVHFPRFRDRLSFRHQFGHAFGEVCKAFGRRRLVIIIDDLDRCRPEQIVEILEAVSFLTANGDCFVLVGLDENQVKHSIGLHHQGVAEEMHRKTDLTAYEARQAYARDYLEKLLNLRVPVPVPDYDDTTFSMPQYRP